MGQKPINTLSQFHCISITSDSPWLHFIPNQLTALHNTQHMSIQLLHYSTPNCEEADLSVTVVGLAFGFEVVELGLFLQKEAQ